MISHNIKWFLGLSVAVHTAALVALAQPEDRLGASGQTLLVTVHHRSGETAAQPQQLTEDQPAAAADVPPLQARHVQPTPGSATTALPQPVEPAVEQVVEQMPSETSVQALENSKPSIQAASTALSREEQHRHIRASVMEFITGQLNYPAIARRKGWQGVVKLELLIESDGHISALHVEETSGYSLLDKAALQSLQLAHVPDAAQWLNGKSVSIIVPVEYRLVDG